MAVAYALAAVSLFLYALAVALAIIWQVRVRRALARESALFQPPVTILKPLCGVDEELEQNLESFARLDYPRFQIVCCAADRDDPAVRVARTVARRHGGVDMLVLAGSGSDSPNPKIATLERMFPFARYDLLLISDSNVRIEPDDLTALVAPMRRSRVGLVYQPVGGLGETTAGAALENLRFTEYAGMLTIALKLVTTMDAGTGKGMLVRRTALEDAGGLARLRNAAAEDYVLCRAVRRAGWKLRVAPAPVRPMHVRWSLGKMVRRHLRHASLRRRLSPWGYPVELLVNPVLMAAPLAIAGGTTGVATAATIVAVKTALEAIGTSHVRGRRWAWRHIPLIPLKDVLMAGIWFASFFHNTVRWRDRIYRLGPGERITPLDRPLTAATDVPERRRAA